MKMVYNLVQFLIVMTFISPKLVKTIVPTQHWLVLIILVPSTVKIVGGL